MVDPMHEFADLGKRPPHQTDEGIHRHVALKRPEGWHAEACVTRVSEPLKGRGNLGDVDRSSASDVCFVVAVHSGD
jgi:hypothetical protein